MSQDSQRNLSLMSEETLRHIFDSLETYRFGDNDGGDFTRIVDHTFYEKEDEGEDFKYQLNIERIRPIVQQQQDTAVTQCVSACPAISPSAYSRAEYDGQLGFSVSFGEQPRDTKSTPWSYSEILKKLYAQRDALCPVSFNVSGDSHMHHKDLQVRASPIYDRVEHMQDIVKRCPNHIHADLSDVAHKEHFLWCRSPAASYHQDSQGRYSVVVPFLQMDSGSLPQTYLYFFKCLNSCVGGPNRRGVAVIFTLETSTGDVLGRHRVDVKICACPGRDRKSDESKMAATTPNVGDQDTTAAAEVRPSDDASSSRAQRMNRGNATTSASAPDRIMEIETYQLTKKPRLDEDLYILYVKGQKDFELLRKIRDSLALADAVPAPEREANLHSYHLNEGLVKNQRGLMAMSSDRPVEMPVVKVEGDMRSCIPAAVPCNQAGRATGMQRNASQRALGLNHEDLPKDKVDVWLNANGFHDYVDKFQSHGFFYMDQLSNNLTLNDLEKMNIHKKDRNRIWRTLVVYRRKQFADAESASRPAQDVDASDSFGWLRADSHSQAELASQNSLSSQSSSFYPGLFELTRCSLKVKVSKGVPKAEGDST